MLTLKIVVYFGFGIIATPTFGIAQALGGTQSVDYNNALGFFVLSKPHKIRDFILRNGY